MTLGEYERLFKSRASLTAARAGDAEPQRSAAAARTGTPEPQTDASPPNQGAVREDFHTSGRFGTGRDPANCVGSAIGEPDVPFGAGDEFFDALIVG